VVQLSLHYFAYGSNLHPRRLQHRVASARPAGIARLADYRLAFHKRGADGSGKGNIVPAPGAEVWGAVYTLSAAHARRLDRIEGPGYAQIELTVQPPGQEAPLRVLSYHARAGAVDEHLAPFDWYLEFVLQGAAHHGLPAPYLAQLHAVASAVDADTQRAQRERSLLGAVPTRGEGPTCG